LALGCQQVEGEDFIETYSPSVVQTDSLSLTDAIASKYDWKLKQFERKKAAYLNANLEVDIYTKISYGDKKIFNTYKFLLLKKTL